MRDALILLAVLAVIASGCIEGETQKPDTLSKDTVVVKVASGPLGSILVDGNGRTLYMSMDDARSYSNCYDQCALDWPPFTTRRDVTAGEGATREVDVIKRMDGLTQVTYAGVPLYYYSQDKKPGDTRGQGIKRMWFVVDPDTGPVMPEKTTTTQPTDSTLTTQPVDGAPTPPEPAGQFIAKASSVPAGSTYDFTYNGEKAILVNYGGVYAAYVNSCPHKGCQVALKDDALQCPCHGSKFDPNTGAVEKGPATKSLTTIELSVVDGNVYAK
ncbi:MAG: Rieske 2Fe-2S domain-containing protein [Candidatus Altiarchaeota archaeon]